MHLSPFLRCILLTLTSIVLPACDSMKAPSDQWPVANSGVNAGAFSDNGQYVVVGSLYNGISYWRTQDRERLYDWNHKKNTATTLIGADFSPEQDWVLTADAQTLVLWDTKTGEAPRYWSSPGEILDVQLSRNAQFALLGLADHTAVAFDVRKGGILRSLQHNNRVRSVALSDDSQIALTGSEDYSAIAWAMKTGEALTRKQHNDDVQLVQISPDGTLALSMGKYDKAIVWRTDTGDILGELPLNAEYLKRGLRFSSARFSHDNQWLLTGQSNQVVSLWKVESMHREQQWRVKKKNPWKPSSAAILDLAFVDEKHFLALASNGFIFELETE